MRLRACLTALSAVFLLLLAGPLSAQAPHFAPAKVRPALIVDGPLFLVLGAQADSSSNYPAMLGRGSPATPSIEMGTYR